MDIYFGIMSFFVKGGTFMAPIAVVGALGLAIAVERYISVTKLVVANRRAWQEVEPALNSADFDAAREKTSKGDTIVARLLSVGLARLGAVRKIDDIEKAAESYVASVKERVGAAQAQSFVGYPATVLLEYIEKHAIDLVVMTTHGRGGVIRAALGSVSDRLIGGPAPVFLVRARSSD